MLENSTLKFLRSLKRNNNRGWFAAHKSQYEDARYNFETIVAKLIQRITDFDPTLMGLTPRECIFRIYRDVRFSKDKSPYKTHFGADISEGGRKGGRAGYYFHIEPGNKSILAGGLYHPSPEKLFAVRTKILNNFREFSSIINAKDFKRNFGGFWEEEKLRTVPKGFPKENPASEYLKHKNYVIFHELTDKQILSPSLVSYSVRIFKSMQPLNEFLNL